MFLVATGVPLQFSGALDLGGRYVTAGPILDWYGLQAPGDAVASAGVVSLGDVLYLEDGRRVASLGGFRGAVAVDGLVAAAGADGVMLLDPATGDVVDRFRLEPAIDRIGLHAGRAILDTDGGLMLADPGLINWQPAPVDATAVAWAEPRILPAEAAQPYRHRFRATMLSVERLLQDVHSGRVLGTAGVVLVDVASALLTFLAISGIVMWWRTFDRLSQR